MSLVERQWLFSDLFALLILWTGTAGYRVSLGEVYRTPEQAALNARRGTGIAASLHRLSLAADLRLFRDGVYLQDSADYLPLGVMWEAMHPLCRWGGRFRHPDGGHFSVEWRGIR